MNKGKKMTKKSTPSKNGFSSSDIKNKVSENLCSETHEKEKRQFKEEFDSLKKYVESEYENGAKITKHKISL